MPAVKYRVAAAPAPRVLGLVSTGRHAAPEVPATVQVLDTQPGTVSWLDKAKAYYHTVIVLVGSVLALLTQANLPDGYDEWVPTAILILTTVLTALKSNEVWISQL